MSTRSNFQTHQQLHGACDDNNYAIVLRILTLGALDVSLSMLEVGVFKVGADLLHRCTKCHQLGMPAKCLLNPLEASVYM